MKIRFRLFLLLIAALFVVGIDSPGAAAQDTPHTMPMPSPTPHVTPQPAPKQPPSPSPTPMPMEMPMPTTSPTVTPTPKPMDMEMPMPSQAPPKPTPSPSGESQTLPNLSSEKDLPEPVADSERYGWTLVDILEFRPGRGGDSDFRWDIEGSYGGDYNRFWYKSEGERNTAFKADYDIDFQLLYGRFFRKYYDFQAGLRSETQTFGGQNVTRVQAVVGIEGLAPYRYEVESALFISHRGDVSVRFTITKNFLVTQRVVFQPRLETHAAVQRVEKFTTGRGMNNIELGFRLRYEIRREFAPYLGVSFDRSFFGTADLVRQEGGDPSQIRFVVGVRMWR